MFKRKNKYIKLLEDKLIRIDELQEKEKDGMVKGSLCNAWYHYNELLKEFKQLHIHKGKNILEIFPDVDFYDYTKINNRLKLMDKYSNYHLTLSYTGYNWTECIEALENGINVAAVFDTKKGQDLPIGYEGYEVVDGDLSDYRLTDPKGVIVGLRFKKVINDIDLENNPFIVSTKETKLIAA